MVLQFPVSWAHWSCQSKRIFSRVFREFFYIQIEKYARQYLAEGVRHVEDLVITTESDLYRVLNLHYNRSNQIEVRRSIWLDDDKKEKRIFFSLGSIEFLRSCSINIKRIFSRNSTTKRFGTIVEEKYLQDNSTFRRSNSRFFQRRTLDAFHLNSSCSLFFFFFLFVYSINISLVSLSSFIKKNWLPLWFSDIEYGWTRLSMCLWCNEMNVFRYLICLSLDKALIFFARVNEKKSINDQIRRSTVNNRIESQTFYVTTNRREIIEQNWRTSNAFKWIDQAVPKGNFYFIFCVFFYHERTTLIAVTKAKRTVRQTRRNHYLILNIDKTK